MPTEEQLSDIEIVQRVLRGEANLFGIIVDRYWALIASLARNYLRQTEDAEDATQEIFLTAYRKLGRYNIAQAFRPWLVTVARNALRTTYRLRAIWRRRSEPLIGEVLSPHRGPEGLAEERAERAQIRAAIANLPASLRDAVVLYYLHEMNVGEIAEALGLSNEAVKSRLFQARKKLRQTMQPDTTAVAPESYSELGG